MSNRQQPRTHIEAKLKDIQDAADPQEQAMLYANVGDIYFETLGDFHKAAEMYREALSRAPTFPDAAWKLARAYAVLSQPTAAMQVLQRLEQLGEDPNELAAEHVRMAEVCRRELDDLHAALHYQRAVTLDPSREEALAAMEEAYRKRRDWLPLCRAYETIAAAVGEEHSQFLFQLHKKMARAYESLATRALERAAQIRPGDPQVLESLGDLYAAATDYREEAGAHERLLAYHPDHASSYGAMYRVFREEQQADRAFCCAGALKLLKIDDPEAHHFFETHRDAEAPVFKRGVSPRMLSAIEHPCVDPNLTRVFSLVLPTLAQVHAQEPDELDLTARSRVDLRKPRPFNDLMNRLSMALGLHPVEVFTHKSDVPIRLPFTDSLSIVVHPDLVREKDTKRLAFLIGRSLAYALPAYYPAVLPATVLQSTALACLKLCEPGLSVASKAPLGAIVELLRTGLGESELGELRAVVAQLLATEGHLNVRGWKEAVALTANRVGLVACGDLLTAVDVIRSLPNANGDRTVAIRDLAAFSVSAAHARVRNELGIALVNR